ncbi:protein-export chaperone SecB [Aeribacillus composti]|jgi:preprotein translocase subunit SecB|uniref:protein-export chaperone SecB n=1 Tax=Aeribacillus composti TaxID=1868734 RepID=UPI0028725F46|nr:protein-export chaperone SecB [Aeribacillus pallidus]MED0717376.1 protein-export chaperone SecB [Aeribacillus composti]MED0747569.1 protein-export chaperone SecB [Aeribacillus composti]
MNAVLQFKEYHVLETIYKNNPFIEIENEKVRPEFEFSVEYGNEKKTEAFITLSVLLGDEFLENHTFFVKAKIMGYFEINSDAEISDEMIHNLYHINALAIIFPYLRSLVSDLSSKGSETPIILPTLNIAELVRKKFENDH